ncbi:MAG: sucrase ferredoxin [Oscillatoriales cyanobacterium RM2_1_1]|nr:sucrase ferredoxin [Oscillatoriales cyanobacterium SM2_3_0]NJO47033.1 sucrase ferredoxin [Oscillatoriales cyanobacterium RM2_1_1]
MNQFFCAEACRHADEDIIGSATNYRTYILIEAPLPWAANAFDSPGIPQELRNLVQDIQAAQLSIRFLLISQGRYGNLDSLKLIIYEQVQDKFSAGYDGFEVEVNNLEQAADFARKYIAGELPDQCIQFSPARDFLVCTHGSHDKCCAKYGIPFYKQASRITAQLELDRVRIWMSSHFGGHRFAPTMIDFPEGRYYGLLDGDTFCLLLTRTGTIKCLHRVYRGWSILPVEIQVLERELMLFYGWAWMNYQVACQCLEANADRSLIQVELQFSRASSTVYSCSAQLVRDQQKTLNLQGSCDNPKISEFVKYAVQDLKLNVVNLGMNLSSYPEQQAS